MFLDDLAVPKPQPHSHAQCFANPLDIDMPKFASLGKRQVHIKQEVEHHGTAPSILRSDYT